MAAALQPAGARAEECLIQSIEDCIRNDPVAAEKRLQSELSRILMPLAELYRTASAPVGDAAKAREYFKQAAAVGEPKALMSLADMFAKGEGGAVDPEQARALLEEAQSAGLEGPALNALGNLHRRAPVPFRDGAKAREYFEQAISAGEVQALISLADMLAKGEGGAPNPERARALLEETGLADEGLTATSLAKLHRAAGDGAKARDYFEQAASEGERWALISLADMLAKGEGGAADPERARTLLEEARLAGLEGPALNGLGNLYRRAPSPFRNGARARDYYEQAASVGERWAMITLANMLATGEGGPADPEQARMWLNEAMSAGLKGPALNGLGNLYRRAPAPFGDSAKAFDYFEQAASAGEAWALISATDMLAKGEGVAADPERAQTLLEEARRMGVIQEGMIAMGLGRLYRAAARPFGDATRAREYFEEAVSAGEPWAMISLADMLAEGEGGAPDPAHAIELLEEARNAGLEGPALNALGDLHRRAPPPFGDAAKARNYYELAVSAGRRWAMISLADMLAKGEGGTADPERAQALLEDARGAGLEAPALSALGRLYWTAAAPFGDAAKAREYFKQAATAGDPWALISLAEMLTKGQGGARDLSGAKAALYTAISQHDFAPAYTKLVAIETSEPGWRGKSLGNVVSLLGEVYSRNPADGVDALAKLGPNGKVAVIQTALSREGIYPGKIDGLLTKATLQAIGRFCKQSGIIRDCQEQAMPTSLLREIGKLL